MKVVLIPGVLALLPEYAGQVDPVPELRAACREAVAWLGPGASVIADEQGRRVAAAVGLDTPPSFLGRHSTSEGDTPPSTSEGGAGFAGRVASASERNETNLLVVANGTATRTEKAPGYLDERARGFDQALEQALRASDLSHLRSLDPQLAADLWVGNPAGFVQLADVLTEGTAAQVDYADDPFGVQYWVMRWRCES